MPTGYWFSKLARLIAEIFCVKFYLDNINIKGVVFYGHRDQVDIACLAFEIAFNRILHLSRETVKKQDPIFMLQVTESMCKACGKELHEYRKKECLELRRIRIKNVNVFMKIAVEVANKLKLTISSKNMLMYRK